MINEGIKVFDVTNIGVATEIILSSSSLDNKKLFFMIAPMENVNKPTVIFSRILKFINVVFPLLQSLKHLSVNVMN